MGVRWLRDTSSSKSLIVRSLAMGPEPLAHAPQNPARLRGATHWPTAGATPAQRGLMADLQGEDAELVQPGASRT